jgi:hypothetical protein
MEASLQRMDCAINKPEAISYVTKGQFRVVVPLAISYQCNAAITNGVLQLGYQWRTSTCTH